MITQRILSLGLCLLMLATAAITVVVTPSKVVIVNQEKISLKDMIPEEIGEWRVDPNVTPLQLSEEMQKGLENLYSQTLVRTYVSPNGERVMLSLAYGGDQSGNLALHKPEHCYGSQGFVISHFMRDEFVTDAGSFPITRLLAVQGYRSEPITYWTTVGDKAVKDGLEQKLQKLRYAMTGKIPDGILVRLSTIDEDLDKSYRTQNAFIQKMLASMSKEDRKKIVGNLGV